MHKRRVGWQTVGVTLVLGVLGLTACSRADPIREVVIVVNEAVYAPAILEVVAGEATKLTLNNTDVQEHQVGIREIALMTSGGGIHNMAGMSDDRAGMEDLQLHLVAPASTQTTLEFTPVKPDQYEFFCPLPGHTEQGTLIVKGSG